MKTGQKLATPAASTRASPPEKTTAVQRVLVVDDSGTMRRSLVMTLQLGGYQCMEAPCAEDALRVIEQSRPHLVLTDIVMPGMGGLALIAEVSRRWPGLPVLALTTQTSQAYRDEAMHAGARAWLRKPVGGTELLSVLRRLLPPGRH